MAHLPNQARKPLGSGRGPRSNGLAEAGAQAANAAHALVGDNGEGGAKRALVGGADVMGAAKDQLAKAAGLLSGLAVELNDIGVPSIEPKYTKVADINVISGVDIGSHKLLEGRPRR
ncbi:MAG: hypothetical protein ACR2GE_00230 [Pseudonocardia sp.]